MKKLLNNIPILALILGLTAAVALAKPIKKQVTFDESVKVNGTLVKAGTYDAVFDDEKGSLMIVKGKRVLATAPARLETSAKKSRAFYELWGNEPNSRVLSRVALKDGTQAVLLNTGDQSAESSQ